MLLLPRRSWEQLMGVVDLPLVIAAQRAVPACLAAAVCVTADPTAPSALGSKSCYCCVAVASSCYSGLLPIKVTPCCHGQCTATGM